MVRLVYSPNAPYEPALGVMNIRHGTYIHNMDEKGARVCMSMGEEIVIPIGIKERYTGILENRLSMTVVEYISIDEKAILPLFIIKGVMIIANWFTKNITRHELITISESGYTNKGICLL
jgi:hypothetical protein